MRASVGEVNDKVDSLGRSLEQTEERTRKNEGRISEVDQKAQAAAQAAQQAHSAAAAANDAAVSANGVAVSAKGAAAEVGNKVDTLDKANRRLVYEVVLSEDSGNFTFGQTTLPAEAKQQLTLSLKDISDEAPHPMAYRSHTVLAELLIAENDLDGAGKQLDDGLKLNSGYFPARAASAQLKLRRGEADLERWGQGSGGLPNGCRRAGQNGAWLEAHFARRRNARNAGDLRAVKE